MKRRLCGVKEKLGKTASTTEHRCKRFFFFLRPL